MNHHLLSRSILFLIPAMVYSTVASGVERFTQPTPAVAREAPAADLFTAIDDGSIEVSFIAQNAQRANVLVKNNTERVLHVQLPQAFAAVPVLAQFDRNQGLALGGGGGATQGVGGGFNQGQQGFGQGQQGFGQGQQGFGQGQQGFGRGMQGNQFGGMMRIPPHKMRKLTATTVCLEHGKAEPNPRVSYRIVPLNEFTDDPRIANLCQQLGRNEVEQNTAQAIAWHLANGLSWNELADINRIESQYVGNIRMFTSAELKQAQSVAAALGSAADEPSANPTEPEPR